MKSLRFAKVRTRLLSCRGIGYKALGSNKDSVMQNIIEIEWHVNACKMRPIRFPTLELSPSMMRWGYACDAGVHSREVKNEKTPII